MVDYHDTRLASFRAEKEQLALILAHCPLYLVSRLRSRGANFKLTGILHIYRNTSTTILIRVAFYHLYVFSLACIPFTNDTFHS